ncbi:hypothetical protein ABH922_005593 [Rhodococcus sp. 27YEA15]
MSSPLNLPNLRNRAKKTPGSVAIGNNPRLGPPKSPTGGKSDDATRNTMPWKGTYTHASQSDKRAEQHVSTRMTATASTQTRLHPKRKLPSAYSEASLINIFVVFLLTPNGATRNSRDPDPDHSGSDAIRTEVNISRPSFLVEI